MDPRGRRAVHTVDDRAVLVPDHHLYHGALLPHLGLEGVPAGERHVPPFLDSPLALLAIGLQRLVAVPQPVGEHGAERRVLGRPLLRALGVLDALRPVPERRPGVEQHRLAGEPVGALAQRGVVVEDEDPAPERRRHQVLAVPVEHHVAERDGRRAGQLRPLVAAVYGEEDAELGGGEEEVRVHVVLDRPPDQVPVRQVAGDGGPRAAPVRALHEVRREVAVLVVVERHVDGVPVVVVRLDVVHERHVRDVRHVAHLDPGPVLAPVLGDPDESVIGAGVDQVLVQRALADGRDGVVVGHGAHVPGGVPALDPAHDRQRQPLLAPGQVAGDRRPAIAPVVAAPDPVRRVVEPRRPVEADLDGRVPVEPLERLALPGLRLDVDRLTRGPVRPPQHALLELAVVDVRVARLHGLVVTVGAQRVVPVLVPDPVVEPRADRTAVGPVVLGPAVHLVERTGVVDGDLVVLHHRQVRHVPPRRHVVEGLVQPAVRPEQDVVRVVLPERDGVVVAVLVPVVDRLIGGEVVVAVERPGAHQPEPPELVRRGVELLVVVGARAARDRVGHLPPALAPVLAHPDAALGPDRLDGRVDDVRLLRRDGQPDLAQRAARQPRPEPLPRLAAVFALPDAGARAAAHVRGDGPVPVPRGRVQPVRVARVDDDVGGARPLLVAQHLAPRLAAVRGLVQTPLVAGPPERALGRDPDHVRVLRVHDDRGQVLGILQPHVPPRPAAVRGLVDPVAVAHVPAAHVLARAHPDDVRGARVDGHRADAVRPLVVEDRLPRRPRVRRLPHAAGPHGHVDDAGVVRVDVDVGDPAAVQRRADATEREAGQAGLVE